MGTEPSDSMLENSDVVLATTPHRIGRVALRVRDVEEVSGFYQSVLGLHVVKQTPGLVRLGTVNTVLVELVHDPEARVRDEREAGLFHTAFLLPTRADLGAFLSHVREEGVRLTGAADHLVSEAVYLNDPEGNGIEIYVDRPSSDWRTRGGMIEMATDPLDVSGLAQASLGLSWSGYPDAGVVGHVHLQVGDLGRADAFYGDLLGFDITCRYPGAHFYGSGGYHHQLAGNIWNSQGAPTRPNRATGLAGVELMVGEDVLEAVRERSRGKASESSPDSISLQDPWGTSLTLRAQTDQEEI